MAGHDHHDQRRQHGSLERAPGFERFADQEGVRHRGDAPQSQQEDDYQGPEGEIRIEEPRPKDHQPLAQLVDQEKQDQRRRHGKGDRQATPSGVQLPEARPQKGQEGGQ